MLDDVKPDVIVTLASFHHLLIYNSDNQVNTDASINMQSNVVDICMRALPDQGILLIADLIETGVTETPLELFKSSMAVVARDLVKLGLDKDLGKLLGESNSLHGASSLLHRELGTKSGNSSLSWFREIVEHKTAIGHKDIAVSPNFLQRVASYRPVVTKYTCPWVFKEKTQLDEFVYKKFAFGITMEHNSILTKEEAVLLANEHLGIRNNHGVYALGWNLGIVLLGKRDPFSKDQELNVLVASLLAMLTILAGATGLRYWFDFYAPIDFKDILVFMLTLPIGIIFGNWITKKKFA